MNSSGAVSGRLAAMIVNLFRMRGGQHTSLAAAPRTVVVGAASLAAARRSSTFAVSSTPARRRLIDGASRDGFLCALARLAERGPFSVPELRRLLQRVNDVAPTWASHGVGTL